jgi:hypothetical protein
MKLERKAWLPYFEALAARMRLGGWGFVISDDPPPSDAALATIVCWYGRFGATLRLSEMFLDTTDEDQRYICVHELVHCYQAHADQLIDDELSADRKDAWSLAAEYGVDAAASTIAPFMPLPSEILCSSNEPTAPGPVSPPPSLPSSGSRSKTFSSGSGTTGQRSSGTTYRTLRSDGASTPRK